MKRHFLTIELLTLWNNGNAKMKIEDKMVAIQSELLKTGNITLIHKHKHTYLIISKSKKQIKFEVETNLKKYCC